MRGAAGVCCLAAMRLFALPLVLSFLVVAGEGGGQRRLPVGHPCEVPAGAPAVRSSAGASLSDAVAAAGPADLARSLASVEFVPNLGQWQASVAFTAVGETLAWLHDDGFTVQLQRWSQRDRTDPDPVREQVGCVVRTRFLGADLPTFTTADEAMTRRNFLVGDRARWRTEVPAVHRVTMTGVWPGIDVQFRPLPSGKVGPFEYDLLLAPGADLSRFAARVEGVEQLRIDAGGRLCGRVTVADATHELIQEAPIAWQETGSGPRPLQVRFRLLDEHSYGFLADDRDPSLAAVVDPGVVWGTFLGGGLSDRINATRWREGVGVWVGGWAGSTDLPTTIGAYRTTGGADAFVARMNDAGTVLQFATYLGGSSGDEVRGLDLGPGDTPTVVGFTQSTDFPTTPSPVQAAYAGASLFFGIGDGFVTRLSATGASLLSSTYLGGNYDDVAEAVFVDPVGAATVVGWTSSSTFPTTPGVLQPNLVGIAGIQADGFVTSVSANGQALQFSTLLGGQLNDQFFSIDREPVSGDWLVAGSTSSFDYPVSPGVVRTTASGGIDGMVTRLSAGGTSMTWSSYFGAADIDHVTAVQLAPNGSIWLGGWTRSSPFPTTPGALQTAFAGQSDGFVARLSANAQTLQLSTLLGGPGLDRVRALDVNNTGVVVVGEAGDGFPVTNDAAQTLFGGGNLDAFLTYLTNNGTTLAWSSYFGGTNQEAFGSVQLANSGIVVVGGWTFGTDFSIAPAMLQPTMHGVEDGVVMKLDLVTTFGDSMTVSSAANDGDVVPVAAGEHELLAVTAQNVTPRDLLIDAVRLFVGGAGDGARRLPGLRVYRDEGSSPAVVTTLLAGPLAVVDNGEFTIPLNGCLVPAGGSIQLRFVGDLSADPSGASAEVAIAIVDAGAWSLRAPGAGAGPEVRVAGAGRAQSATFLLGALPGDVDGDEERTVIDVRRLLVTQGSPARTADTDGDGVIGPGDVAATRQALLGRTTPFATPTIVQRGAWLTLPGVFPEPGSLQATLGGQALTIGCATPRELALRIASDLPVGPLEFVLSVEGSIVIATLVDVQ